MRGTQISDSGFGNAETAYREIGGETPYARRTGKASAVKDVKSAADEELVLRLKRARDEEAFNEIVNRYADVVFMLALRVTLDPYDAGEVLQEAFLALETPHTFRGDVKFSTWFYRIVLSLCFARLGAEKKHKSNDSMEEYPPCRELGALERTCNGSLSAGSSDAAFSRERLGKIVDAMGELPAGYRAVFQLADVEGLTDSEVAEILGLSVECVKSRICRARFFLTEKLSDYFYRLEESSRVAAG